MNCRVNTRADEVDTTVVPRIGIISACVVGAAACDTFGWGFNGNSGTRVKRLVNGIRKIYYDYIGKAQEKKSRYETLMHCMVRELREDVRKKYGFNYEGRFAGSNAFMLEKMEAQDFFFIASTLVLHKQFEMAYRAADRKSPSIVLMRYNDNYNRIVNRLNDISLSAKEKEDKESPIIEVAMSILGSYGATKEFIQKSVISGW